ncbi:MAG: adenylyl-sulfate kinase [Pseudomonadota bacterium]
MSQAMRGDGMVDSLRRRSDNTQWQALSVKKLNRAQMKFQRPVCIWLTGLSGSGKSTVANLLERRLHSEGRHTFLIDGDNVRHGLSGDLGFSEADRAENIRRVAEVARLMVDAGLIVIVSLISPYRADRQLARSLFDQSEFIETFIDASVDECERRDPKGLYAKARCGELKNFTGIDSRYEPPISPDVHLNTIETTPTACVDKLWKTLLPLIASSDTTQSN